MRIRTLLVAAALASALAGCGGGDDDGAPTTTVTPGAGKRSAPAPATTTPAPPDTGGALAVQGTFGMTIARDAEGRVPAENPELEWIAAMTCSGGECTVDLRRQEADGGYETSVLEPAGPRAYADEGEGTTDRCPAGPTELVQRISVTATDTEGFRGIPVATAIEGRITERYRCSGATVSEVVVFRGLRTG